MNIPEPREITDDEIDGIFSFWIEGEPLLDQGIISISERSEVLIDGYMSGNAAKLFHLIESLPPWIRGTLDFGLIPTTLIKKLMPESIPRMEQIEKFASASLTNNGRLQ